MGEKGECSALWRAGLCMAGPVEMLGEGQSPATCVGFSAAADSGLIIHNYRPTRN